MPKQGDHPAPELDFSSFLSLRLATTDGRAVRLSSCSVQEFAGIVEQMLARVLPGKREQVERTLSDGVNFAFAADRWFALLGLRRAGVTLSGQIGTEAENTGTSSD